MRTIICNIMNLDVDATLVGLQNVVRMIATRMRVSVVVVRGYVLSAWQSCAQCAHAVAEATAKPALAALPVAPTAVTCGSDDPHHGHSWQAGFLSGFGSCSGRGFRG